MDNKDFQEDFNFIMDMLKNRMGINNAIIRKLEGEELKTVAYFGYDEKEANLQVFVGQGVTGRCAAEKKNIVVDDLESYDGNYIAGIKGAKSELCIPLTRFGKLIGTLNIESLEKNNFTPEKIRIAEKICETLAHGIANPENSAAMKIARAMAMLDKKE